MFFAMSTFQLKGFSEVVGILIRSAVSELWSKALLSSLSFGVGDRISMSVFGDSLSDDFIEVINKLTCRCEQNRI